MTEQERFIAGIRALMPPPIIPCIVGTVVKVEGTVCVVELPDGFQVSDVRLKAAIDTLKDYVILFPKIGSTVLLSAMGVEADSGYYIVAVNEIERIEGLIENSKYVIDKLGVDVKIRDDTAIKLSWNLVHLKQKQAEIIIQDDKIKIQNAQTTLKEILGDMVSVMQSIKVLTGSPGSLSPVSPAMLADFTQITQKINQLS